MTNKYKKQIELLKYLTSLWMFYSWQDENEYCFEARLYPTDRYVKFKHKEYDEALFGFANEIKKYSSNKIKKEIEERLNGKNHIND